MSKKIYFRAEEKQSKLLDPFENRGHLYNSASLRLPQVRHTERKEIIDLAQLQEAGLPPVVSICDLQSAGGYLSIGCMVHLGASRCRITCVEPFKSLAIAIPPEFEMMIAPLENTTLKSKTFDRVLSLAGLHHCEDLPSVLREAHRILKDDGLLVLAEVEEGTPTARFLNEFVDQHSVDGHKGVFVRPGDFTDSFASLGMVDWVEYQASVPWIFVSEAEMAQFCKELFGLARATLEQVHAGISQYLGFENTLEGVRMNWSLRYGSARKK